MFPVGSLKKNLWSIFGVCLGEKICSFSAGQTLQTLVLSQPKHKLVSKPPACLAAQGAPPRAGRARPPRPRRFALGAELGTCELSTLSTSRRCSHSPFCTSSATGALSAWGGGGEPRVSDNHLPDPMKPCWVVGGLAERMQMSKDGLRDSGPSLWVMLR